ncbi:F0F1 ATP synthase subunit B [Streptococcus macacae]|uniref:ATP synthase subunit b n=1 Tax=Streptococcus macacae NCTC 11558 TaxID=764298 RepID=G5JWJ2_9STRE|nr:F0F1 ATP synthase subunit B [Streptococcus macacae]EHJ51994.1 ATP synthase F0, B subunit [Streptococcus macacae NCTC 11558]SUN78772.1 ATP synthase B chain [Streptococcus macacae NCTC 11558]
MSMLINSTSLGNLIITTGSVILLFILIKRFAWKQLTGIFEARDKKIADDIDSAQSARQEAEVLAQKRETELSNAKDEANQIVTDAKATGEAKGRQIVTDAREQADQLKEKANQDIEQDKAEALSSVKEEVADLSVRLAEKIMASKLDKEAQSNLIDSYLDDLGDA